MSVASQKCILEWNFQLLTPLKFGSPVFHVLMETQNWCWPLQKMEKIAVANQKRILEQTSNYRPPYSLGLWFSKCLRKRKIGVGHYGKWEKWP